VEHTFLFEEGLWKAEGTYLYGSTSIIPAEGFIRIVHEEHLWVTEGVLKLLLACPVEFQSRQHVEPFQAGRDFTFWTSEDPNIGPLNGKLVIVDDSILSTYDSADRSYSGVEYLVQTNSTVYLNRGFVFKDNQKLSSWAIRLTKVE
jgi:hypothetical protein